MNQLKLFPELHGDETLFETTRVTMTNVLELLAIPFTVNDRRHSPVPSTENIHSYMYNFFVTLNNKKYSFLIGDFSFEVNERLVEVYPIQNDIARFYYTEFKHVLNALHEGDEEEALKIMNQ